MPDDLKMDAELKALIERAKKHVVTDEEAHKQRVSYVLGNMPSKSKATADDVEQALANTTQSRKG